jgi:quercetin dioxygenase-like cupin family protein
MESRQEGRQVDNLDMAPIKSFSVFGEPVEILTNSEMTAGRSTVLIQSSPPGGGPPPHSHKNEDETFFVLEGEYELLLNGVSHKLIAGESMHAMRGSVHAFRNVGTTPGKMLTVVVPAGLENYLEEISVFSIPDGMLQVLEISKRHGITFAI